MWHDSLVRESTLIGTDVILVERRHVCVRVCVCVFVRACVGVCVYTSIFELKTPSSAALYYK